MPPDVPGYVPVAARHRGPVPRRSRPPLRFELLTVGSGEAPLEQMVQARLRAAGFDGRRIRQLELCAFLARVYGPAHDFDAAVLGVPGDAGPRRISVRSPGWPASTAPADPAAAQRLLRRLDAGGLSLSRAGPAGDEPTGARGDHGSAGRAADGARLVGGAVSRPVRAAAPVRLDFAGGWTDVPPFSAREGGVVVSAAIGLYAHAEVRLGGSGLRLVAEDLGASLEVPDQAALERRTAAGAAAGRRSACCRVGACTLTTRRTRRRARGSAAPARSTWRWWRRCRPRAARPRERREIAELACRLEGVEAGIPGGRQDQFTAAFGGLLRMAFRDPAHRGRAARARPRSCWPSSSGGCCWCYTGASRFSGATIERVMARLRAGRRRGDRGARTASGRSPSGWSRRSGPATCRGSARC